MDRGVGKARENVTNTICLNCSLWNTSRIWGPMDASCGLSAMIWSRMAGLDMRDDICCRNSGDCIMF